MSEKERKETEKEMENVPGDCADVEHLPHMAFWKPKFHLKHINAHIMGSSQARYHSGFRIPELGIHLDAGLYHLWSPNLILVTHGHSDHSRNLTCCKTVQSDQRIMVPKHEQVFHRYVEAFLQMNYDSLNWKLAKKVLNLMEVAPNQIYYETYANQRYAIETFKCFHTIPTVGYGISHIRRAMDRDNPEVKRLLKTKEHLEKIISNLEKTGLNEKWPDVHKEYKERIKQNQRDFRDFCIKIRKELKWDETHKDYEHPLLCYVLDTSHLAFEDKANQGMWKYPYIVTECTFIEKTPEEIDNAIKKKHVHWLKLRPHVEAHPECTFILTHFSMKYSASQIREYFQEENLKNIVIQTMEGFFDFSGIGNPTNS